MSDSLSLPFEEWPEPHKKMWLEVTEYSNRLDDWPAAGWSPRTRRQARQSYGRWLRWLLHDVGAPASLIVPDLLIRFARDEIGRIKAAAVCNMVCHIMGVAKSAAPDADWGWLLAVVRDLDKRARRERRSTHRIVPAQGLYALGLSLIQDAKKGQSIVEAQCYVDGLLISLLISEPQRVSAFAAIELGSNIKRGPTQWHLNIASALTKTKRTERGKLPPSLTPLIDFYVDHLRPRFARGLDLNVSKRFWLGSDGKPLSANDIRNRIKNRTAKAFGFPIYPHTFRHIALTTFTWDAPEFASWGPALLGDSAEIAESHYLVPQRERALKFWHELLDGQSDSCDE